MSQRNAEGYFVCPDCGQVPGPAHWDWDSPCPTAKRERERTQSPPRVAMLGIHINAADFEEVPTLTIDRLRNAARFFGLSPVIWSDHHETNWLVFTAVQQRPR